jgi:hypothetical protein
LAVIQIALLIDRTFHDRLTASPTSVAISGLTMVRRHRRMGFLRPKQELEKLRPARQMLVKVCTEYPMHSDAYRKAAEAMAAIDEVAEALIGDRQFF